MLKYICTEVTFSPDKWANVILRFDVIKEDKETFEEKVIRREEVTMPFYTFETVRDKKTGEEKVLRHGCMQAGDFTKGFRHAITCKALATFFPGELTGILRMTDIAMKICGTHELVALASVDDFLERVEKLSALLKEVKTQNCKSSGRATLKTLYAWLCLRSIVEVFDAFTRDVAVLDEDNEDNDENDENDE